MLEEHELELKIRLIFSRSAFEAGAGAIDQLLMVLVEEEMLQLWPWFGI